MIKLIISIESNNDVTEVENRIECIYENFNIPELALSLQLHDKLKSYINNSKIEKNFILKAMDVITKMSTTKRRYTN